MTPRQPIFVSAVSGELRESRDLVAKTLYALGYEPVWQDVFGTEEGDLRLVLNRQVEACKGLVQLVGWQYGAESPVPDPKYGRVSYTQYEAIHALHKGKKVWYLIDQGQPVRTGGENEELDLMQRQYRDRLLRDSRLYHLLDLHDNSAVQNAIHGLRDELACLRRSFRVWIAAVSVTLLAILGMVTWNVVSGARREDRATPQTAEGAYLAKDHAKAFQQYGLLVKEDPGNLEYHRRIEECARAGNLARAMLDYYSAWVALEPGNPLLRNYLGNAHLLIDPTDSQAEADKSYQEALRLDPQCTPPLANLGILAFRSGRFGEAEEWFTRYLDRQPQDAQAWVNLGLLHMAQFDSSGLESDAAKSAERALRRALEIDPGLASGHKALSRLLHACGRNEEAVVAATRSLALDPDQPELREWMEGRLGGASPKVGGGDEMRTRGINTMGGSAIDKP